MRPDAIPAQEWQTGSAGMLEAAAQAAEGPQPRGSAVNNGTWRYPENV